MKLKKEAKEEKNDDVFSQFIKQHPLRNLAEKKRFKGRRGKFAFQIHTQEKHPRLAFNNLRYIFLAFHIASAMKETQSSTLR